jgi:hypothetical protein
MNRLRVSLLAFAAVGLLVAVVQHVRSIRARADLERERLELIAATQQVQATLADAARQKEAARAGVVALAQQAKAAGTIAAATPGLADEPRAAGTTAGVRSGSPTSLREMRALRVQVFASEQRMQFAALLHRLGFSAAQRQAFDRIQETYYAAMLDETLEATGRDAARDVRAEALRELFGPHHDAWVQANQQQRARAIVDQIIQQTFPSSGALSAAQADELTRIVAESRRPESGATGPGGYDWERIISEARTILADGQMDDFVAAVTHRRASDQMAAIAAKAKR